jgi:hypothetical protein
MDTWKCLIDDTSIPSSKAPQTKPNPTPVKTTAFVITTNPIPTTATVTTTQTTITPEVRHQNKDPIINPKPSKVLQRQAKNLCSGCIQHL